MANIRKPPPEQRLAVAFSGGRDSSVLLDLLSQHPAHPSVLAFHIDHGLQAEADAWVSHCEAFCRERGIALYVRHVQVHVQGQGTEAAAREARYAALRELARELDVTVIALAHHAHDQAETALFNLARGAGSSGLAAMPAYRVDGDMTWWRPLLETSTREIAAYAEKKQLSYIEDPSNLDLGYARNRIRHEVLPALQRAVPGALKGIARGVRHAQGAAELERQAGEYVLSQIMDQQRSVSTQALRQMPVQLRNATLRSWCLSLGVAVPSEVQLLEWWRQLSESRSDAQMSIAWDRRHGGSFCCYRDRIYFVSNIQVAAQADYVESDFVWSGQPYWQPPGWKGHFSFQQRHGPGIPAHVLQQSPLQARKRQGGERLRTWPHRHHRSLKHWYQARGIPAWQRQSAPLLFLQDQLLFVPGVGMAAEFCATGSDHWVIDWIPA
jgi:tRNA(Ile)-lysidine synthase